MIHLLFGLLMGVNVLLGLHFALTTGYGALKSRQSHPSSSKLHRFAILIAARNEEEVIGYLIDSLKKQAYPREQYEIFVLPNHCSDQTEQVSRAHGATILPITDEVTSKGEVLNQAFSTLQNRDFEAYAIIDADNVVDPNFLKAMNEKLNEGVLVIQGFRDSKNATSNWLSGCYSIFYWIQNFFYQTRENLGASAAISGTGFVLSQDYLKQYGYEMHTLTEDMELAATCALKRVRIGYTRKAIIYDEQPTSFLVSWRQRKRWTTGGYQCLKEYGISILKQVRNNPMACLDQFWILFAPILQVFTVLLLLLSPLLLGPKLGLPFLIGSHLFGLFTGYCVLVGFAYWIVKLTKKEHSCSKKAIIFFPLFIASWVPIQILCLFDRTTRWDPIAHRVQVEVTEVMKQGE